MGRSIDGNISENERLERLNGTIRALPKNPYPVGSIFMNLNDVDPAELFGGRWRRLTDVFLFASGDYARSGDEGGEFEHLLSVDELPSHRHNIADSTLADGANLGVAWNTIGGSTTKTYEVTAGGTLYAAPVGEDESHNNMPPYLAVNMWLRIA